MKYQDLISEDVQAELRQMSDLETSANWRLGSLANSIFYQGSLSGASISMNFVCCAVAHYRNCSTSRVAQCARIEGMFPPQDRVQFEQLPFSHFEFASRFGDPLAILQYSLDHLPISVSRLEEVFEKKILEEQADAMEGNGPIKASIPSFMPSSPFEASKPLQVKIIAGMIETLVSMVQSRFFEKFPQQEIIRSNILNVISGLQNIKVALGEAVEYEEIPF